MSKIQDALRKIQLDERQSHPTEQASREDVEKPQEAPVLPIGQVTPELDDTGVIIKPIDGGLVAIDRDGLRSAGYLAPQNQERHLADQYRLMKRPLLDNASGRAAMQNTDANLIMVSSALPGDGKTFNCINLALSMALEKDITVLLVDADVAKPHISTLFGVSEQPGLIDVLNSEISVDAATMRTDVPRLSLLPAGAHDVHATELLASRRMGRLVHELSTSRQDRIVIFDSPPLLATSEAGVLASFMGQIALVVRSGKTPQRAVLQALNGLDEEKAINVILNESASGMSSESYGNYGYGYGSRPER